MSSPRGRARRRWKVSSLQTLLLYRSRQTWLDLRSGEPRRLSQQTLGKMKLLPAQAGWSERLFSIQRSSAKAQHSAELPLPRSGDELTPSRCSLGRRQQSPPSPFLSKIRSSHSDYFDLHTDGEKEKILQARIVSVWFYA